MQFFRLYQYVVPAVLFPLCYWQWLVRYDYDHKTTLAVLSIPIVFSYVIPGLGTNWLKIWEFNTRWRLGRFRPQHGFLFGTATSLFGLFCLRFPPHDFSMLEIMRSGFVMGSVIAFWNWLYDFHAIRVGFLMVYNRASAEQRGPAAIATEYCPLFFGLFGSCYGITIRVCEYYMTETVRSELYWPVLLGCHAFILTCPVALFIVISWLTTGETGLRSYQESNHLSATADIPQDSTDHESQDTTVKAAR